MPGKVLRIMVEPGQTVQPGQPLLVVEAMKMEQTVRSQTEGLVKSILVKPGEVVAPGQTLVQITGDA
jgi:3-methylcrotonyl-CoA carboxylase alpha subunit